MVSSSRLAHDRLLSTLLQDHSSGERLPVLTRSRPLPPVAVTLCIQTRFHSAASPSARRIKCHKGERRAGTPNRPHQAVTLVDTDFSPFILPTVRSPPATDLPSHPARFHMRYLSETDSGNSGSADDAASCRKIKKRRVGDVAELWGCLIPWNAADAEVHSIELSKTKRKYTIGSSPKSDICLPCSADVGELVEVYLKLRNVDRGINDSDASIDETHCVIEWDGTEGNVHYAVKVTDRSRRGTYVSCAARPLSAAL